VYATKGVSWSCVVTIISNHRRASEPKGVRPHREEALMGPAMQNGKICYCAAES
jgi:hypothetical protein